MPPPTGQTLIARAWHALRSPWFELITLPWHIFLVGALLSTLLWSAVAWEIQRIRQHSIATFGNDLSHLTAVLDETLVRHVQSIDNALLILRGTYLERPQDMPRMVKLLQEGTLKGVETHVTVIDRTGHSTFTDIPDSPSSVYLGDRAHFRVFAEGGPDQLYIGAPVMGRLSKRWGIQLARPIISKEGRFLGVIVVFLPPEQLTRFMQEMDIGSQTIMSIISPQGRLLSRSQELGKFINSQLSAEQMAAYQTHTKGFSLRRSVIDQVERGIAYRWTNTYPLLLVVSKSPDAIYAEISSMKQRLIAIGLGVSLIIWSALFLLARSLRQRQDMEAQLQREHSHLIEAQRLAQLGSWDLDLRSGHLYWSDEMARILEIEKTQLPQTVEAYLTHVHPDDRQDLQQTFVRSLKNRTACEVVHRLRMRDGRIKWLRGQWVSEFDRQGFAIRSSGTLQDITERQQAEAERNALTRERLLLLESTGEGIYGIDTSGTCTFINQAGARMLGYEASDLIGKNIHEWVHHKHADGTPYPVSDCPVFLASVSGESCKEENEVFWRRDGQPVPVSYAAYPIREGNNITGTVVTYSDISERKRAEIELRIAEKAFQTQEGLFVTDDNGTILRVNDAFSEITGYSAAEVVGKNPRFRSSGRQDALFYATMWARIKSTGAWKGELWNRRKNGVIYPESVTITAVRGNDSSVTHYVATMHDISERKSAEEAIHQLAYYDALTKLPNRRLLHDRLHHALASSARHHSHGVLMFIDLDKFKALNDTLGHDIGDLLLQQVAQRLLACVREVDTVARLGGDEFVILLEELSAEKSEAINQAQAIGQKILAALNETYDLAGHRHHSTPSIGGTLFCGQTLGADELIKQADLAMYQSKAAGRNTLRFFDPAMLASAGE